MGKGDDKESYILREASEAAHIAYRDITARSMRMGETDKGEKNVSVLGGSDADSVLLAYCLFRRLTSSQGAISDTPVPLEFVKALPRRVTSKLIEQLRTLSGMDEDQESDEFLSKRIAADTVKLETLRKKVSPPSEGQSSISTTSV